MSIVHPATVPDEIANGYKGRVFRFNGLKDPKHDMLVLQSCVNAGRKSSSLETSAVELLATVAKLDLRDFIADHTLIPLMRAVARRAPGELDGGDRRQTTLQKLGLWCIRPGAYLCWECVKEDLNFHGFTYWRREHQLPGRFRCAKHDCALHHVPDRQAFLASPSKFLDQSAPAALSESHRSNKYPAMGRFLGICANLLQAANPQEERLVSLVAIERAQAMGLKVRKRSQQARLVSDLVKKSFDSEWLESVLPGLAHTPKGTVFNAVDGTLLGHNLGFSTIAYALVFAVLYDDADEASNAILSPSKPALVARVGPRTVSPGETSLRASYLANQGHYAKVAADTGLRARAIPRLLQQLALPNLSRIDAGRLESILYEILRGTCSLTQAAKMYGVDIKRARSAIRVALTPSLTALDQYSRTSKAGRKVGQLR